MEILNNPRSVVVTGAAAGMGAAIARRFAADGDRLLLCDLQDMTEVTESISAAGGRADSLTIDLRSPDCGTEIVSRAVEIFGRVDVVIHNAGVARAGRVASASDDVYEQAFAINLWPAIRLSRAAIPEMQQTGGGVLLFTGALGGQMSAPNFTPYALSKAALAHLVRCITVDHGRDGIRANCVAPGPTQTNMLHEAANIFESSTDIMKEIIPTGRFATPEEIAATFAFLASEGAASISGQVLVVDGGMSAGFFPPTPVR